MKGLLNSSPGLSSAKCILAFIMVCGLSFSSNAQNLVPNGSFEEGITCPSFLANLEIECANWYSSIVPIDDLQPTPDWFHTCSTVDLLSPPEVAFGIQQPAEGGGYAGLVTYRVVQNPPSYREIVGVQLIEPLVEGNHYLVEFKISSLETAGYYLVNDKIGFNFSTHPTYDRSAFPINQSHFAIDSILTFSNEWSQVSTTFEADSSYNYLHIGNFFDDENTSIIAESEFSQSGYYVIDDVSVSQVLSTSTPPIHNDVFFVYPNPSNDFLSIHSRTKFNEVEIHIYSLTGIKVHTRKVISFDSEIMVDLRTLVSGPYILSIVTPPISIYNEKFIKQ